MQVLLAMPVILKALLISALSVKPSLILGYAMMCLSLSYGLKFEIGIFTYLLFNIVK